MNDILLSGKGLTVVQAQLGDWDNLNHLLICEKTHTACIIDPFSGSHWLEYCRDNELQLEMAALTHSHWDHSKGVGRLFEEGIEIMVHELESERGWKGPDTHRWNHDPWTPTPLSVGELIFEAHCTPGHTPGHVTIIGNGVVISGDCLFLGRCGRADLHGGDVSHLHRSLSYLKPILERLPVDWLILPGHQYALEDGRNPTFITVGELLKVNEALKAVDDEARFMELEFLAFDDSLAEKARRTRAKEGRTD